MNSEENTPVKAKSLHPEFVDKRQNIPPQELTTVSTAATELDERIRVALAAAGDKKAINPIVLDLREVATFTDFFVITSGANVRQVQAIADSVVEQLKGAGTRAARVEGYNTAEWILIDYGDFIFHVFDDKARAFYDLERLWRDAATVNLADADENSSDPAAEKRA